MSRRPAIFDLMLVVDPRTSGVLEAIERLARLEPDGEQIAIQLRAKEASDAELITMAREVTRVAPSWSRLIVNGRVEVARAIAADGVHLPEDGVDVAEARRLLGEHAIIGCSCHDEGSVTKRSASGCDYVLLGPVGPVPGKPPMDHASFTRIAGAATVEVLALGGIDSERAADHAIELGASGIAVQRALLAHDGPRWLVSYLGRRRAA